MKASSCEIALMHSSLKLLVCPRMANTVWLDLCQRCLNSRFLLKTYWQYSKGAICGNNAKIPVAVAMKDEAFVHFFIDLPCTAC